jgi:hypothetical protein
LTHLIFYSLSPTPSNAFCLLFHSLYPPVSLSFLLSNLFFLLLTRLIYNSLSPPISLSFSSYSSLSGHVSLILSHYLLLLSFPPTISSPRSLYVLKPPPCISKKPDSVKMMVPSILANNHFRNATITLNTKLAPLAYCGDATSRDQCHKTFYARNLIIFVIC